MFAASRFSALGCRGPAASFFGWCTNITPSIEHRTLTQPVPSRDESSGHYYVRLLSGLAQVNLNQPTVEKAPFLRRYIGKGGRVDLNERDN